MQIIRIDDPRNRLEHYIGTILSYASFDDTRILCLCTKNDLLKLPNIGPDRVEGIIAWLNYYDLSLRNSRKTLRDVANSIYGNLGAVPMALMNVRVEEKYQYFMMQLVRYVNVMKRSQLQAPLTYVTYGDIQHRGIGFLKNIGCSHELITVIEERLHEFGFIANN